MYRNGTVPSLLGICKRAVQTGSFETVHLVFFNKYDSSDPLCVEFPCLNPAANRDAIYIKLSSCLGQCIEIIRYLNHSVNSLTNLYGYDTFDLAKHGQIKSQGAPSPLNRPELASAHHGWGICSTGLLRLFCFPK